MIRALEERGGPRTAAGNDGAARGGRGRRIRILYVESNEDGTVGGSHQVLYDFLRHIDRERFEPIVLFYQDNPFRDRLRRADVEVHLYEAVRRRERHVRESKSRPVKYLDFLAAVFRRARTIRKLDIDIVHLNNAPTIGYDDWLPACRALGVPCVANAMGRVPDDVGPLKRALIRRYDRVLASSSQVADSLRKLGLEESLEVLPLGVDVAGFRRRAAESPADVRKELDVAEDTLLAAMVGHVRPWKGQHLVLEAVASLPEQLKERLVLLLVGDISEDDGGYGQRVVRRAHKPDLRGCVRYLGRRDDVPRLLKAADVAVHASCEPEPFGLVIVEAMSVGRPVIAADLGGPRDIVEEDSGRLVDPSDPAELGDSLRFLLENPQVRRDMGAAARRRAEVFDIRRYAARIETVYEELLKGEGRVARPGRRA